MNTSITIGETTIHQDEHGRFCLNDFHRAAGWENRHRPSLWAENKQTQGVISELNAEAETKAGISALVQQHGGVAPGTYVVRELVYAYAMWISPAFHLKVIRAFDAMATGHALPRPMIAAPPPAPALPAGPLQDRVSAFLVMGQAIAAIPGVNVGIAYAHTLDAIHQDTGLITEPLRKALPAASGEIGSLNPTKLGRALGLSAQKVNKALEAAGLQHKNQRGEWELTEAGAKYGEMVPYSNNGHAGYQPLWKSSVLDVLRGIAKP